MIVMTLNKLVDMESSQYTIFKYNLLISTSTVKLNCCCTYIIRIIIYIIFLLYSFFFLTEGFHFEPAVIVGVVGIGHVQGIVDNWEKDIDVQELMR